MKRRTAVCRTAALCALAFLILSGCKAVVTVMPSSVTIDAGEEILLEATSTTDRDTSFVWSSADEGIATVDDTGLVVGVNEGQTVVTARGSSSGSEGQASITVNRPPDVLSALEIKVDESVIPVLDDLPPIDPGGPGRPLAAIVDERGNQAEFVEDELILVTDDLDALEEFLGRWDGELLWSVGPEGTDLEMPQMHLVRINTDLGDPSQLEEDILTLDPDARGASRVSSEAGLRLISASAAEAVAGTTVGMNWVGEGGSLATRFTTEAATGPNGYNSVGSGYTSNAFNWNHLDAGSTQDIGVTEAWYLLARTRKLNNKVKVAVLDMGFSVAGNLDVPPDWIAISNVPFVFNPIGRANLLSCTGGTPCDWHGTDVLSAAMAVPDNSFGAAGPAGPIAQPIMIFTLYDFFTSIGALIEARVAGARVLNMSYGTPVPAILAFTVIPFEIATYAARNSMLLVASAGNNGKNVDAEDCFIVCWEETWWTPCENAGVMCVGGLARNSKNRATNSNYGNSDVDMFAPYSLIVGPSPDTGPGAHEKHGTSFSAPYVAGVAALVMAANPSLSVSQVRDILISTAHPSPDNRVRRYVNARAAVSRALGPLVLIESPTSGASISGGFVVTFTAFVHEDGKGPATVQWNSNLNGNLGTGMSVSYPGLSYGTHTIRARATFADATVVEDTITITVVNNPPTVNITSPLAGATYFQGQPVLLAATSYDVNEPGATLTNAQMAWYVDNVLIGTGHNRTIAAGTLSLGTRTIRVTGTDSQGLSNSKTVNITINPNPPDLPPDEVIITSPTPNAVLVFDYDGQWHVMLVMEGSAHDPEDGDLTGASLTWRVSVNGGAATIVGTGTSVTQRYNISEGETTWDVTLTAKDSAGNETSVTHRATTYLLL